MPEDSGPARNDGAPRIAPAAAQGNPEELQSLLDTLGRPPRPAPNLFLAVDGNLPPTEESVSVTAR